MKEEIISVLIVDDEPLARKRMQRLLNGVDKIKIEGIVGTGREAIRKINSFRFDIVFLDIQLKDMTGFQVLKSLNQIPPLVIFVTAFDSYAIKAFEVCAFDYLLKPYTEKRFYKSLQNAIANLEKGKKKELGKTITELLDTMGLNSKALYKSRIPIPDKKKTLFVSTKEIRYIKASNYYIEIYSEESKYVLRDSMHSILEGLDPVVFTRIHRSSIVNLTYIVELVYSSFGELDVKMPDGVLLRVSKGYRKGFLKKVGIKE
ncbi:LytR/AlgR family response regulator transcription factor [Maribacter sp. 2308TA10-17]|uniref:LytR/AlgR family response regulator transcription factor n=1 Tax=Maribacter sp. 2308TA10-17 TaxID=3386276 RepID=UPI0039BD04CF